MLHVTLFSVFSWVHYLHFKISQSMVLICNLKSELSFNLNLKLHPRGLDER